METTGAAMESDTCFISSKSRFVNPPTSLHFEQKIVLNGHCDALPPIPRNNKINHNNGLNEHKRWSTSDSKETGISDVTRQSNHSDANSRDLKLPSYVGISCAISGYSSYSRYCSSARGSVSRGSSPVMRNYEVIDGSNGVHHHQHHVHHHLHHNQLNQLQQQPFITSTTTTITTTTRNDPTHNNNGLGNGKERVCPNSEFDDDDQESKGCEKSLVQRRIESLYGPNAAEIWRDSRSKVKKVNKKSGEIIAHRSPSCPPHALQSRNCKKSPAVFNNLNEKFLGQIDGETRNKLTTNIFNNFNKVVKINGENGDVKKENGHHHPNHHHPIGNGGRGKENGAGDDEIDLVKPIKNGPPKEVKRGEMYIKKLEETIKEIQAKTVITEKFLEEESHLMSEEVTGNLRSSIGKANLLIAQKLKQFRELCHKNINGNDDDQFSTKNEDLDGFWEMVYIQVQDIDKIFQDILTLRQNNWIIEESFNPATQPKIRSPRKISSPKASPSKQPGKNTARDEMRRMRLREAKLKQAARFQEMQEEEIAIFIPPNNDHNSKNNGSKADV